MDEGPSRPRTPAPRIAGSEGDPLRFMDPYGFDYSSKSSLKLAQQVLERTSSSSPGSVTSAVDIATATTAVTDALNDALKMQVDSWLML